ncbi:hypothetical protein [Klebsiella grimontii]|uniref:Uncharacterized protein n=1 Tax=Klebsiella grimontii TaxID=2058152 RepID=A0A7H9GD35_9ENTR|nr:hypothetical protein [Klebsiella grimontii]BAS39047.1 hypothetical protein KOJKO3_c1033 [Klebsiella oxytoca]MBA8009436.1 hypothetical protein [Klebsiella grimontii]MBA8123032.1 hypothetical protein [Klebsiella grimontii]QLO79927.1 hypothetical protein HV306_23710 [Klebsiella grimontii]QLP43683.1 hypothetical protein HV112_22115 [Klebsiella grimontii]
MFDQFLKRRLRLITDKTSGRALYQVRITMTAFAAEFSLWQPVTALLAGAKPHYEDISSFPESGRYVQRSGETSIGLSRNFW